MTAASVGAANVFQMIGYVCGLLPFVGLPLYGLIKSLSIARRPATNTKSCIALGLFNAALLLAFGLAIAARRLEVRSLLLLAGGVLGIGLLASVVLALVGLFELRHAEPGQYTQGRRQAWLSLVLSGVVVAALGSVVALGLFHRLGRGGPATAPIDRPDLGLYIPELPDPWYAEPDVAQGALLGFQRRQPMAGGNIEAGTAPPGFPLEHLPSDAVQLDSNIAHQGFRELEELSREELGVEGTRGLCVVFRHQHPAQGRMVQAIWRGHRGRRWLRVSVWSPASEVSPEHLQRMLTELLDTIIFLPQLPSEAPR